MVPFLIKVRLPVAASRFAQVDPLLSQDVALPLMRRSSSDIRAIDGDGGIVDGGAHDEDEEEVIELLRAEAGEPGMTGTPVHLRKCAYTFRDCNLQIYLKRHLLAPQLRCWSRLCSV